MSDVKEKKANVPSTNAPAQTDSFGNPIDPTVGFARGSIIRSSIDEALRLRHGQAVAARRVKMLGAESIGVFTGNQRDFPIRPEDIATLCEEWVGPGLEAEELRQVAIGHMGARGDDAVAIFNRTSAGIIATIAALAKGRPVVSVVPPKGRSHASVVRGAKIAGVPVHEVQGDNEWLKVIEAQRPALVVITTVTSSLERLEDHITLEVGQYARALGAKVFLDEAYGARLRTVLHGGRLSLQLGADIAVTNCDKAGLSGPRAGVLVGRAELVTAAAAKGAEFGMEARAPITAAVLRSLQKYQPEDLRQESAAGQKLADALAQKMGADLVQRSDLGPMVEEDAVLRVLLKIAGRESEQPAVVPCEATSALGMVLLEDHGILTVNTHGQPGARVSLRLKPTLDALGRTGGFDAVVSAVMQALDKVAAVIHDRDAIAQLILGK